MRRVLKMANWSVGSLKIRGTIANLKRLLEEGLEITPDSVSEDATPLTVDSDGTYLFADISGKSLWLKGTDRHFITDDYIEHQVDNPDDITVLALDMKAAWGVNAKELQKVCRTYGVDMKVYAFESGLQYNQDIAIVGGKIVKNKKIKFADYDWDCIRPNAGG
jgi:hypothetical protein